MTAPEPTAEHINAVARAMRKSSAPTFGRLASDLLTSTDPAAHAALAASLPAEVMLAALVDRGALTAESSPIARPEGFEHWQQRWDGEHTHEGRRFVTPWEVAP